MTMITGIGHVAFRITDLDRALAFCLAVTPSAWS